ncbi:ABC transporter permease subunit [Geomonas sp. RF6]|uniref:ABC transporter permease/substrate-binding protein n=1 Tax=Geomonas sp. RF6 TaxID=2897342 RepID=UPI001E4965BE|nr:glycine betaine ABC transporter substrate-binding protein [Geomonas sp. RF6]UFS69777.1 ABC transporter permease subunit [Geomonas sp. RF6]
MTTVRRQEILLFLLLLLPVHALAASPPVRVGSKVFTESVVLGEVTTQLLSHEGVSALHRRQLGGTRVLWGALLKGEIDIYPEYTGTISEEILAGKGVGSIAEMRDALARHGIRMTESLGFEDSYAIGMKDALCRRLGIAKLSDLQHHPDLALGFSNEFMDRGDGWPGLRARYRLPQKRVFGMDHDLAYRGLHSGAIAATDLYSTDAEIGYYHLRVLEDDLHYFPRYTAVLLYRADLEKRGAVRAALAKLAGRISQSSMIAMNERVKIGKVPEAKVAADFLAQHLALEGGVAEEGRGARIRRHTAEHLYLVALSLCAAVVVAIPLGIVAAIKPRVRQPILGAAGVIQTIPSLALLVFMIPLLGIGSLPVVVALFLYSLLPIVRNTCEGLRGIAPECRESAEALGLPLRARLWLIDLPLASREILAGVKTSAVINVGTATLGALIGAGGYGQPILTGIRLDDTALILEGAVPAALLALLVQALFELAERVVVPKGLRIGEERNMS